MKLVEFGTTHHIHEQIAVDLSVVFLHLLLNVWSCQLLLGPVDLFILEGSVTGNELGTLHVGVNTM